MRILHVDDDEQSRRVVTQVIEGLLGHKVTACADARQALKLHCEDPYPIVISDIRMPGMNGLELLHEIKQSTSGAETEVVLITGFADLDSAVAAIREGAADYLRKPIDASELLEVIKRLVLQRSIRESSSSLSINRKDFGQSSADKFRKPGESVITFPDSSMLGLFSSAMRSLAEVALRFHQDRSIPVIIEGETGTGKEMFARLIHYGRQTGKRPFVVVNCAAITPTLFESELFGYVGGAFTGAKQSGSAGKFEVANGGTIFFDEVAEIPLSLQPKLLRVLQEQAVYRVGGNQKINLDFRLITATNRDLEAMVKEGSFRQDLYYRLNVGHLSVPPIRKQKSSIPPIAQMFLSRFARQKERCFRSIHPDTVSALESYSWPGNIRELENVIRNAVLLYDGQQLLPEHINIPHHSMDGISQTFNTVSFPVPLQLPEQGLNLEELNRSIVEKVIQMFDGNQSKAARYLGMSRYALRSRIKKLDR